MHLRHQTQMQFSNTIDKGSIFSASVSYDVAEATVEYLGVCEIETHVYLVLDIKEFKHVT